VDPGLRRDDDGSDLALMRDGSPPLPTAAVQVCHTFCIAAWTQRDQSGLSL